MKYLDKNKVELLVVHCSDTKPGQLCDAETIDRWHTREKGWAMIGYHYVILPDGTVENGRPLYYQGAHAGAKYNARSIGICYVGGRNELGVTADTRTDAQRERLLGLLKMLKRKFPSAKIVGHCDLDKGKACPCFDAKIYNQLL